MENRRRGTRLLGCLLPSLAALSAACGNATTSRAVRPTDAGPDATTDGGAAPTDASSADAGLEAASFVPATVGASVDTAHGVGGRLEQFLSTSFQPADWDYQFFQAQPEAASTLNALGSQHIRVQVVDGSVPWKASSQPAQPSDWDFSELDAIVQPVLAVADRSPEMQLAVAPSLPGLLDADGNFILSADNLVTLSQYYADVVRYYNTGGFDWGGVHFQSPSSQRVTWWGIFNEYNIHGLTASQYVELYDAVVPAMLAVDPTLKLSAVELADYDYQEGDPRNNLPRLLAPASEGGLGAPVDVLSTHFYSTCNSLDSDRTVFATVPSFADDVAYFHQQLAGRTDLASTPVWVTENNVNSDYPLSDGGSACNAGQPFVLDPRGTSAFFAAWRPYVFSQLGKAGARGLYHWVYSVSDPGRQYSEVDFDSGAPYLSYWVDYWLGRMLPSTPTAPGPSILQTTLPAGGQVELLATRGDDGDVVIMVVDRAVHAPADDNGAGDPRSVMLDVSALGPFSSATELVIDAHTDVVHGPTPSSIPVSAQIPVVLGGYGVAFVSLTP
jgi:hypothetical protein